MKLSDLDLSQTTVWDGSHLWLTLALLIGGFLLFAVSSYLYVVANKRALICFAVGAIGFFVATTGPLLSESIYPLEGSQNDSLNRVEKIQEWADNNYAIELSAQDANVLLDGQQNYDEEESTVAQQTGAFVDYYNDEIVVRLVKTNGQWKLFSNDKALTTTGEGGTK